ncbi:hypothetical protein Q9S78_11995 [Microbacterium sp. KSW-18]|uniref:Uncharacterized protein n=1 Tax=Microbacterium aquilitoris TaxID=3067307 RepID=A0ABU3GL05_9MICO|nr:hypothetical protein [Microbacterium sp. KSW-18]MDT3331390.1 hypothetical protein [Microbacterium sp. KSW-18]
MGRMRPGTVDVTLSEFRRRREEQSARIASVRGRAAGVLGASGLAVTLVSAIGTNGGYIVGVVGYLFATVYAVKSMTLRAHVKKGAAEMVDGLAGLSPRRAREEILVELTLEIEDNEDNLRNVGHSVGVALGWFIAGTAFTAFVAVVNVLLQMKVGG